jgi:GT2 family glycosyltransferase
MASPLLSVIIVSYNTQAILRNCLRSLVEQTTIPYEIIVVDNMSQDNTCTMIEQEFPEVRLVRSTSNKGFAHANNQGLRLACGHYVLFLNPDTVVLDYASDTMVAYLQAHPEVGLLGPSVLNADGYTEQASVFRFPTVKRLLFYHIPPLYWLARLVRPNAVAYGDYIPACTMPVEIVSGCCMAMPTALVRDIGGMNEAYFMYSEEFDLCEEVHARGKQVLYFKEARIIHLGGASTSQTSDRMAVELLKSMKLYIQRVQPDALAAVRLLYIIGSAWRYVAWTALRLLGIRREQAQSRIGNHSAMLRWLLWEFNTNKS